MTGRFDRPGMPEEWPPDPLELPAYQWTAPRGPESIYRAPETGGDPLESVARFQRMLDDLSREQRPPPHEIAASDRAALESALSALLAGIPGAEPAAPWMGEIGSLFSLPLVIDDTLPPGRVELRDRGGNVIWTLLPARPATGAEHAGGVDGGMPERFVAIDPAFFALACAAAGRTARESLAPGLTAVGETMHTVAQGMHAAVRHAVVDLELEAAPHWPAPDSGVCAHVCGADADHRCDARASTSLRFTLPSGGLRDLPLCGPCAQAESDPAAAQHDD